MYHLLFSKLDPWYEEPSILIKWLVKKGDLIERNQEIYRIKAKDTSLESSVVITILSPVKGKVIRLVGNIGDSYYVGDSLMFIDTGLLSFLSTNK